MLKYRYLGKTAVAALISAVLVLGGCSASRIEQPDTADTEGAVSEETDQSEQIFTMGTVFSVRAIGSGAAKALSSAESTLYDLDGVLSWRTEGSLPAQFNEDHEADMSEISDLISQTLEISKKSGGALDPTVLPLTKLWNFDRIDDEDFDISTMTVPDDKDIQNALKDVDYTHLSFDKDSGMLTTDDDSVQMELGAVGKGYAIDKAMDALKSSGMQGALISAGSSIGTYGTKEDGEKFNVALRDPRGEESDYIGVFNTSDCTISTSGDYERYFEQDGKRYHHILDPHTGYPAESGLMQVTIICDSGALGDALSTACFVLGLKDGMLLAKEYNVSAIFVDTDKNVWYNNSEILDILEFNGEDSGYSLVQYDY